MSATSITFKNKREFDQVLELLRKDGYIFVSENPYCETSVVKIYPGEGKKVNVFREWSRSMDAREDRRITAQEFLDEQYKKVVAKFPPLVGTGLRPFTVHVGDDETLKELVIRLAKQAGYNTDKATEKKLHANAFRFEERVSGYTTRVGFVSPDKYSSKRFGAYTHFNATTNLRGLIEFLPETKSVVTVKLNNEYTAVIRDGVVEVGCQKFSTDKIKEIAKHL